MAEALGAAATLVSIIGFSAQCFDGCIKGFVLLSSARNLGRDGDILRSMLDWEHFRLEQFGEKARLHDPRNADMLLDWNLVRKTLEHLQILTNDAKVLREKYHLDLVEHVPGEKHADDDDGGEKISVNRFKRLFCQTSKDFSTAASRVIQAKSSSVDKVKWAAVDKNRMKILITDISYLVQKLHEMLDAPIQEEMHRSLQVLLQEATNRYADVPDLNFLRDVADSLRRDSMTSKDIDIDAFDEEIDKKFRNLFFYAIRHNEPEEVREFLDKGIDVQVLDHVGWPPLVIAAEYGHLSIVELLVERGADPSIGTIGNRLPLHFASEEGHTEVVRLLLRQAKTDPDARDYTGRTAVFNAADKGHYAVLELLLSQPFVLPNPPTDQGFTPLLQAIFGNHTSIVRLLLARSDVSPNQADRDYNQTPLWMAVTDQSDGLVQLFLQRKDLDLNARSRHGETALGRCARQSYNENMRLLIDAGADVHIPNDNGRTPLSCATIEGNDEGVAILLAQPGITLSINTADSCHTATPSTAGKDKPNKDTALTPLHHAALDSHLPALRALLRFAPSPLDLAPLSTPHLNTPLHLACGNGHKVATKLILNAAQQPKSSSSNPEHSKPDQKPSSSIIDARNKYGDTPLALAALGGHEPVVRLLMERGADPDAEDEDGETVMERVRDTGAALRDIEGLMKELKVSTR